MTDERFSIRVEKSTFERAMSKIARIVERRATIPILDHVRLSAEQGCLTLTATDMETELCTSIECRTSKDSQAKFGALAPAAILNDIARKTTSDEIKISLSGKEQIVIRTGRAKFSLPTLLVEDFPDIAVDQTPHRFSLKAATFSDWLARAQFAISADATRYYLNGVFIHKDGDKLRAVSTDGHRLARIDVDALDASAEMPAVIIPKKAIGEIIKLAKGYDSEVLTEFSDKIIRFSIGGTMLTSKLIEGQFPDYQRVIPKENSIRAIVAREKIIKAIDRVATIYDERGSAIALAFEENLVRLSTLSANNGGSAQEELEAEYAETPLKIGFNNKYLLDALQAIEGENVTFELSEPGAPAIIRDLNDVNMLIVLMPVRI